MKRLTLIIEALYTAKFAQAHGPREQRLLDVYIETHFNTRTFGSSMTTDAHFEELMEGR